MGFWSSLAGAIFGWSDSVRGKYDAETQNRTEQQRHERVKDLKNLEQRLSIEKEKADAEIEKFRHETMTQTMTEMQKLQHEDLKFRSEFAAHLMTTIQKIQTDYLSQITSILLGYKTEHTSAVKELEAFYGKKMLDLRDELREERDVDIRDLLIGDYKELRTRGSNLMNTLINRVDKDVETMQTFVLEHTKSNALNANLLLDKIIGHQIPPRDKAKLLKDIEDAIIVEDDESKDK
jgi:hypothetical protein